MKAINIIKYILNIIKLILGFIFYIPGLTLLGLGFMLGKIGSLITFDEALKGTLTTIIKLVEYKKTIK